MIVTHQVLAYEVIPGYDERGDTANLLVKTESRDAVAMKTLYDDLVKNPLYRVGLYRIERTERCEKLEFRRSSLDNPFVT